MAAMRPRDKKGCFRRLKETKRREMSAVNCKRPGIVVEEVEMGTEAHCHKVASSYEGDVSRNSCVSERVVM